MLYIYTHLAGVDFGAEERSTRTAGVGRHCFVFEIVDDSIVEGDEQFRVVFSNLPTNQIGRTSEACVTILDDGKTPYTVYIHHLTP